MASIWMTTSAVRPHQWLSSDPFEADRQLCDRIGATFAKGPNYCYCPYPLQALSADQSEPCRYKTSGKQWLPIPSVWDIVGECLPLRAFDPCELRTACNTCQPPEADARQSGRLSSCVTPSGPTSMVKVSVGAAAPDSLGRGVLQTQTTEASEPVSTFRT